MRRRPNNKGAILILAFMVLFALVTLSSGLALFNFGELSSARRYRESTAAFWLAEAGISIFLKDPEILKNTDFKLFEEGTGRIQLKADDSDHRFRKVISTGIYRGLKRSIQLQFPVNTPDVFLSSVSTKGDIQVNGKKASVIMNGKVRTGGRIVNRSKFGNLVVEDKVEGVDKNLVSLIYPDADNSGKPDEFTDFVEYNKGLLEAYAPEEVVHLKGNDTFIISPNESLKNAKIVYVEGTREGEGNAVIQLGPGWGERALTVIATGKVTMNIAGKADESSQVNVMSWGGYSESAAVAGGYNGVIFTHGTASFEDVHDSSVTNGSVIANEGIKIGEVWSTKTFNYRDMRKSGALPPGFEGMIGGGSSGYSEKPVSWKEVPS